MGRRANTKGREKRHQRKEEQLRLVAAKAVVDKANKLVDPLEPFTVFRKFTKNDLEIELSVARVKDLNQDIVDWAFNLTKKNMEEKYNDCSWKWDDAFKRDEMSEDAAWYLLAKSNNECIGFSHFRFDLDHGDEVLYCYELQLEKKFQRKGLGKFMMQVLELMAFKNSMKKVVLTVLDNSPEAKSFYSALNYKRDETSPISSFDEEYPYEILSKLNRRLMLDSTNGIMSQNTGHPTKASLMMHNTCCSSPHCHS